MLKRLGSFMALATILGGSILAGGCVVEDVDDDDPDTTIVNPPDGPDTTIVNPPDVNINPPGGG